MKIKIGKYRNWFGPYQISDLLKYVGFSEDSCEKVGDWLSKTWINAFLTWIDSKKHRTIKIRVDDFDVWNADYTLALINHAVLKKFRESGRYGVPHLDDTEPDSNEYENDEYYEKREDEWNEILDKMIWSFDAIINSDEYEDTFWIVKPDYEGCKTAKDIYNRVFHGETRAKYDIEAYIKHEEKIQEGLNLYAKYFKNLLD